MNNSSTVLRWVGGFACAFMLAHTVNGEPVRLHGAVAFSRAIEAQKAAIESKSGAKLEVVGNGGGRGLMDVVNGKGDLALIAGSLKLVAEAMNKEKPGSIEISELKEIPLMSSKTVVFANSGVGVKKLTDAQMASVLTGKVTNWKEVGGADLPIKVVLPFGGDGSRLTVQNLLFPGVDYAKDAIIRNSAKDLGVVVAQLPGACSVTGVENVEAGMVTIATEKDMVIPWSLVAKGEPSGDVKKVIEAATSLVK